MTTVTLATVHQRPLRLTVRNADGSVDTWGARPAPAERSVESLEQAATVLTLMRLVVLTFLGTGAAVAGAVIGRL